MRLSLKIVLIIGIAMFITGNCLMHMKDSIDPDKTPDLFDRQMKMYYAGIAIRNVSIPVCLVMFICLIVRWIARLIRKR